MCFPLLSLSSALLANAALPATETQAPIRKNGRRVYRYVCLAIWLGSSAVMILDRFYWNVWPRQTICSPGCGNDFFCDPDEVQSTLMLNEEVIAHPVSL